MNVATQYNTEAKVLRNAPSLTRLEHLDIARDNLADHMTLNHELRHDLNMAAWRELHAEHLAAGRFDIAANIMTQKIIPNRA
jgi:hypothetical protein